MYRLEWVDDAVELTDDIVALIVRVSRSDPFIGLPPDPSHHEVRSLRGRIESALRSGRGHLLVLRSDATAVGCVLMTRAATSNQHHIAELTTGAVDPGHRGRGLVSRAFAEVADRCRDVGIELLRLDVREGVPAERIWKQFGFTEYGRLPDYGRVDGQRYAGVYLAQSVRDLSAHIENWEK